MAEFVHFGLYKYFDLVSSRKIILTKINKNITRPIEPVTPEIYSERIKKNEVSRNKKLTHCINMAT
jgi:hypothetical protein